MCSCTEPKWRSLPAQSQPPSVGSWAFPGGKIQLGEGIFKAGLREIKEELGLPAEAVHLHPAVVSAQARAAALHTAGLQAHLASV